MEPEETGEGASLEPAEAKAEVSSEAQEAKQRASFVTMIPVGIALLAMCVLMFGCLQLWRAGGVSGTGECLAIRSPGLFLLVSLILLVILFGSSALSLFSGRFLSFLSKVLIAITVYATVVFWQGLFSMDSSAKVMGWKPSASGKAAWGEVVNVSASGGIIFYSAIALLLAAIIGLITMKKWKEAVGWALIGLAVGFGVVLG